VTTRDEEQAPGTASAAARVRVDKWLWAARFFKTRSLASQAIDGGKVDVNGERVKRARALAIGDTLTLRRPPFELHIVVRGLSETRGPAKIAVTLYEETAESRAAREKLALELKQAPGPLFTEGGRPTKRDRRLWDRLRDKE